MPGFLLFGAMPKEVPDYDQWWLSHAIWTETKPELGALGASQFHAYVSPLGGLHR